MKVTSSEAIKSGERELIDSITGELDWGAIEEIFKERHGLTIEENVEYKQGDIVAHNDKIAYKLDFEARVSLSVLLDREGNYLALACSDEAQGQVDDNENVSGEADADEKAGQDEEPDNTEHATEGEPDNEVSAVDHREPDHNVPKDIEPPSIPGDVAPEEKISHITSRIADMIPESESSGQEQN